MRFRVHHVAISVRDMAESIEFYRIFGFDVATRYQAPDGEMEIVHMVLGDMLLEIFRYRDQMPAPASAASLGTGLPRIGVKHFALVAESVEDAKRLVESHGITTVTPIQRGGTGVRYFFLKDPSGNLFEIVE